MRDAVPGTARTISPASFSRISKESRVGVAVRASMLSQQRQSRGLLSGDIATSN